MKTAHKIIALAVAMSFSCSGLLEEKPQLSLVVPTRLSEFRALLDNTSQAMNLDPGLVELSADDLTLDSAILPRILIQEVNAYKWAEDIYEGENIGEWDTPFKAVHYANVVLDQLPLVPKAPQEEQAWKDLEGSALFYRAYAYWTLAKSFCLAYDDAADQTLGLPIRRSSVITDKISRASLEETFAFILDDLNRSLELLGSNPSFRTRPSKEAAFALLAEVYLYMGDYEDAAGSAAKSLEIKADLMDYNKLSTIAARPFVLFHPETVFYSSMVTYLYQVFDVVRVDPVLYATYDEDDLRKEIYYVNKGSFVEFKGTYTGMTAFFSGLSVDQVMLTQAECLARLGREEEALAVLNELLSTRWKSGQFEELKASPLKSVLDLILEERRKSLVFRGVRWADLKRLNTDPRYAKDLTRTVDGTAYTLEAGSPKYALPIPEQEINLTGIAPNPR